MIQPYTLLALFLLLPSIIAALPAQAEIEGPHAVIFMYHRFGEAKYPNTNVTLAQFEEQLDFLEKNNFSILPLEDIVQALKNNSLLPDKAIAITIDDAYRSVYEEAYPRLKAKGYPFTVFVATGAVDREISAYMSWDQIREMQENGVRFANHSQHHDYLVRKKTGESQEAWKKRIISDLETTQNRLLEELGQAPALFAYPYGEYSLDLMEIIGDLDYIGFGQHSGGVGPSSDLRALPRFPVAEAYSDMTSFREKALSLALPVLEQQPVNPLTTDKRPELTVTLATSSANLDRLACFIGDRRMAIQWLKPGKQFQIRTKHDLPQGRSRYNCTAPDSNTDRYFWFSHPWLLTPN